MTLKMHKLILLLVGLSLMMGFSRGMADETADVVANTVADVKTDEVPSNAAEVAVSEVPISVADATPSKVDETLSESPDNLLKAAPSKATDGNTVVPTQQEKTVLSTILKSFKNGHVDLATLATALNDPNLSRLAANLSKANLYKLASVLREPQVNLPKLVAALSDPDLNIDKLVATFGDPTVLPPHLFKPSHDETGIMAMMKGWANQIGDSLKGHMTNTSEIATTGMVDKKKAAGEKHDVGLEKAPIETQKPSGEDGIPYGFERSTPSPDANTYGKSLLTGVEVTTTTDTTDSTQTEVESESGFNHRLIYYAVAGVLGLSMCIFLATRLSKSYRGEDVEETRSSVRMVA